ncbi:FANCI solenoid 2-domain-containing protein [Mycotypha africana]|uniref:FANCI solenoid 2-domain-containing protein n=1 Tax=Mycotypha africana TaxID=64632 RepID=UPI00230066DE|nr:FANCI solenoid 2-domain-containing protein [Mycotypha africana]KAI8988264.1 FANCI solenoid 2-domain-containing protein [Mycotypha africana]
MDIDLLKLSKQTNKEALTVYLNEQTFDDIQDLVRSKLNNYHSSDEVGPILLLRAIIQGSPVEGGGNGQCLHRRFLILQNVIEWLGNEENDTSQKTKQASSIVNLLLPEIELLSPSYLGKAANMIVDIVKANRPIQLRLLDIFTKIWNVLSTIDEVSTLNNIFDDLLEAKWYRQLAVGMASALNDMELSDNQLQLVVKYMIRKLSEVDLEEVPPFIWQLLLISRKGYKSLVLNGILDFFNVVTKDKDTSRVEGTVMLHISFALKQDQELGNELIKLMKNDKSKQLQVFNVACLLTAARIHRLQDAVFDLLKSSIISAYKDNDKLHKNHWIAKYTKMEEDAFCKVLLDVTDKSASAGWDQIIQSLTQLAILLIDTATSFGSFLASKNTVIKSRSSHTKEDGPMERLSKFGVEVLLRLFKYHDIVRGEIFEQITSRIMSKSSSTMEFLSLLGTIMREYPDTVESHLNNIKDILDVLSFLPLNIADKLLQVVQPLSKTSDQFRNSLILVLRKSLFSKDLDGRLLAVRGFLSILDEQMLEASQNTESDRNSSSQAVVLEILGLLRRCLSQQAEVRSTVYSSLGSLSQEYPIFAGDIFELFSQKYWRRI